jgi:hypothetical protein
MSLYIKDVGPRNISTVSTKKPDVPLRPAKVSVTPSLPLSPDEIIDYIEIQYNDYQPTLGQPSPHPSRVERHSKQKGSLIDIWI